MKKTIIIPILLLFAQLIWAQIPNITYSGLQANYATGIAITTVIPTNTGGTPTGEKIITLKTGYETPKDISYDSISNSIYIVNGKIGITKLDINGSEISTFGTLAYTSISVDKHGIIYAVRNDILDKYDAAGNLMNRFAAPNINGNIGFSKVAIDKSGNIYWLMISGGGVLIEQMDSIGGNIKTISSLGNWALGNLVLDANGNIYCLQWIGGNSNIVKMDPNGDNKTNYIVSINNQIWNIALDQKGNLFGIFSCCFTIEKWNTSGVHVATYGAGFNSPAGIAIDNLGNIYVADNGNNAIKKISLTKLYTIQPELPQGLMLNEISGVITGTPTLATPPTTYTVTACNTFGQSVTTITFATIDKPSITYTGVQSNYPLNTSISALTPTNAGSSINGNFTIQPDLPFGLNFNTTTGEISGTPTVTKSSTIYTISASNMAGQGSTTITFSTSIVKPIISYSGIQVAYPLNFLITALVPANIGSPVIGTYMSIPSLPSGLNLDPSTGIISGTPIIATPSTIYTIIAGNSVGTASTTITFETISKPNISYSGVQAIYALNTTIAPLTPTNTGGVINGSYFIIPDIPAGLSIDVTTGVISGTPIVAVSSTTYTVVAGNIAGQSSTTITFATNIFNEVNEVEKTLIRTFPNPVKNILHIESDEKISYLELINVTGEKLICNTPNNSSVEINLITFKRGTYLLKVNTINSVKIIKVVKE